MHLGFAQQYFAILCWLGFSFITFMLQAR